MVRFFDFHDGDLLVLTEDFIVEEGWRQQVRPDFSWWMMEEKGIVGYAVHGLDDKPPDLEFLKTLTFRVVVPQLSLFNAGIDDVAAAAYSFFIEHKQEEIVDGAFEWAYRSLEKARTPDDLIHALENWSILYHVYGDIDAIYWMGYTCARLGMHGEAIRWLEKFLCIAGDNAWAHCQLGLVYLDLGIPKEAQLHLETAVCIDKLKGTKSGAARLLRQLEK
jgi:tetratricopeptide (TPR) repeat protein